MWMHIAWLFNWAATWFLLSLLLVWDIVNVHLEIACLDSRISLVKALAQASAAVLKRARKKCLYEASPLVASLLKQRAAVDIVLESACPIWGQSR